MCASSWFRWVSTTAEHLAWCAVMFDVGIWMAAFTRNYSPRLARIMFIARVRKSKPQVLHVHYAFVTSSHVSSLTIYHIKLKPTYTPPLKQSLWIVPPTYPLQETPTLPAITFERPLPLRAIVQVPISMALFINCCNGIDLLDSVAHHCLDELIIPMFGPVNCEAYDNERLMSAVVQA